MKVTREYVESLGFTNSSEFRNSLRYEIHKGVRVMFLACAGGWTEPVLWIGGGAVEAIPLRSVEQFQALLKGLGKHWGGG